MKSKTIRKVGLLLAAVLVINGLSGCGSAKNNASDSSNSGEFSEFTGEDLDGNKVDQSILKEQKYTVLNFWFNGCSACVSEMPDLEKLNEELKKKDAVLVGVNIDDSGKKEYIDEAKEILSKEGATYKNIIVKDGKDAKNYIDNLMAFPTTIIVDVEGNIIGDPICGSLDEDSINEIIEKIQ